MHQTGRIGLQMMSHPEQDAVGLSTEDEPLFSGPIDRRTLLKAVPATLVAGAARSSRVWPF